MHSQNTAKHIQKFGKAFAERLQRKFSADGSGDGEASHVLVTMDGVGVVGSLFAVGFPARCWEDVLVALVPLPVNNLARMTFILLNPCVIGHAHIFMDVKVEQWP